MRSFAKGDRVRLTDDGRLGTVEQLTNVGYHVRMDDNGRLEFWTAADFVKLEEAS
jgi:hypothetical protein